MKAIILNSGTGSRMGELTKDKPKCLIEIKEGETILSHQLKTLLRNGINDIIITTGPFEEKIKNHVNNNFPHLQVTYVHSPEYASTNYIYSLFLAKDHINKNIILIHGDMIVENSVFKKLLHSEHQNAVLTNHDVALPEKDFKGRITNDFINEIGVNTFGDDCVSLLPIYKFSEASFKLWIKEIESFVSRGEVNVYAENAFNNISRELKLKPVQFGKDQELCMELDNFEDLLVAKKHFDKL
jgi:L-glutamine-phosphate cytidylyltransferase